MNFNIEEAKPVDEEVKPEAAHRAELESVNFEDTEAVNADNPELVKSQLILKANSKLFILNQKPTKIFLYCCLASKIG